MKNIKRTIFFITIFLAAVCLILANFEAASVAFRFLFSLLSPLLTGCVLAFFLSIPLNGYSNLLKKHAKKPHSDRFFSVMSLLLTILTVLIILAAVGGLMIPALVKSASDVYNKIQTNYPRWLAVLASYGIDTALLEQAAEYLKDGQTLQKLIVGVSDWIPTIFSAAANTAGVVGDAALGIVLAVYLLLEKKTLGRQLNRLMEANLKDTTCQKIRETAQLVTHTFQQFFSGQCLEAVILGVLTFFALTICGVSYAGLIGVLTAVCSFIPLIGAFLACCMGTLLNLMIDPWKAVLCIVVCLIIQFIEGQFIYPKVVGNSVGLSSFWVLTAVVLGQNLFGVFGMILFIPLTSVVYTLLKNDTNRKIQKKHVVAEDDETGEKWGSSHKKTNNNLHNVN